MSPRRFTGSAETWYYSIPDYECVKGEVNWSALGRLFQDIDEPSLARKAKTQANKARFREVGYQRGESK